MGLSFFCNGLKETHVFIFLTDKAKSELADLA